MKNKYKAVIIGAGRIAAGFDTPKSKAVLTHAHAYTLHSSVDLAGICDTDHEKTRAKAKKWSIRAFDNLAEMCIHVKPDIISVCTPDETHFEVLKTILKYSPKLVICEKPVTINIDHTKKIIGLYKRERIPLLVNYSRRFDTTVQNFKAKIESGEYGKVLGATGIYTKGILHNGSHMIDLVQYLFGEINAKINALYSQSDYLPTDKTVSAFLQFKNCPQFFLMGSDERSYSIFELDILFAKKRIRFLESGFYVSEQNLFSDPLYSGYTVLDKPIIRTTNLSTALSCLVENAVEHLETGAPLLCDGADAYKTQVVCSKILKKL
ncbi:MAG: hypothetical protein A2821_03150 [Candidatus Magasanikbacteria bacterium RIFCSPHIGHO2_01_FULL_41_23]|uniref:Gfo/Idh/MocA-like oxidoreductase N-terminal domain-containing protein n=1 Tax=Candidatus Magasanikbacteria bacterium RIFCSPLOWO2_01_FULL_40_15 TaxID=1798686 RepID=A0A1F6N386_9BACT|nr:MAG: hypothetical protein A2821_03150 [Candidatus Magasanikbacteria bacterium RIFCSPHIGHO2_01_FULL_41_23]OGH67335.1 MAG: hypothetical protein A3C66_01165 [Candidatus Magasanikbacteria bacterium RIFCSPHIGHO2_02_FULL_41_35]OGH76560.1 MAG: hypothetical protein A3F22_00375 [Candidatus Magasanikbacteria bacterium RIFCSPHIGHO2_12_FULL_41_16]OGH78455.1 MAG: hypothetical protein A2983_02980 [Candidatus Magasanikbacteria bacterium RIFCSPLOWO2_01_FULL_40_15]